ncbi:hypothetical protein [Aerosakkonema funiforme]|uniref:Uncharacterized protein n=1 Tax=Aerosakkonema funiforme FACHB-1375 TaxID=2949571 RepID=A0A926V9Z9_9CYAN|nr:hypothetical protein [Aerosakkonema funiforme FACHB-1375]
MQRLCILELLKKYLNVEAEDRLRKLLATKYDLEDLDAFINLQQATMIGRVRQESREKLQQLSKENYEEYN